MDMEIRLLGESDLESLLELYIQLDENNKNYSLTKSMEIWKEICKSGNISYIGAIEDNRVIASCYLVIIPNLTAGGKSIGFIENVITDVRYRKQGIGKKIIEMAINISKENDCYKVILQSGIKREEAHTFYRKIGFDDMTKKAFDLRLNGS
jgi:GNAT superfamily N-acetyltransferase